MFAGSPNIVINIDKVEVAQPKEINLEFGQNVWGDLHIETNARENAQNEGTKNDSRVNDKFLENFHNSSVSNNTDVGDMKVSAVVNDDEEDNLSYFVHKQLNKRQSEDETATEQQNTTIHENEMVNKDHNNTEVAVNY